MSYSSSWTVLELRSLYLIRKAQKVIPSHSKGKAAELGSALHQLALLDVKAFDSFTKSTVSKKESFSLVQKGFKLTPQGRCSYLIEMMKLPLFDHTDRIEWNRNTCRQKFSSKDPICSNFR